MNSEQLAYLNTCVLIALLSKSSQSLDNKICIIKLHVCVQLQVNSIRDKHWKKHFYSNHLYKYK